MKTKFGLAVLVLACSAAAVGATEKSPTAVDLLFNARHLDTVKKGDMLNYEFQRAVENSKQPSQSFADGIVIEVTNETPEKAKNVTLKVFSGDRARDPFTTPGMTGNPLLIWYLNRSVSSYNQVAGGSPMYLKGKFRKALGDDAKVEATKIDYDGKSVDGHKISIVPFANDPAKPRMNGYENSVFEILISDQVPGHFHTMSAQYFSNGKGTSKISETITLKGVEEEK